MLFHTYLFALGFLPACVAAYYALMHLKQPRLAVLSLIAFSLLFYSWWNIDFLWILIGSILCNYLASLLIVRWRDTKPSFSLATLCVSIVANLAVLGLYKYACLLRGAGACQSAVLPLAISFFTFQQIEFLLDIHNGRIPRQKFTNYALFVTFFPHLIAGPITRHSEMMPQFERPQLRLAANLSIGITIFVIGLGKKVFLADQMAIFAAPTFDSANAGNAIAFLPAWIGAVGFTLQLYFDFSGYSDMAIGIGRMFGIMLPLNFDSPFKAANIVEFWQRWHLTLTRYITAHLYNPMVSNLARSSYAEPAGSLRAILVVMAFPTVAVMTIAGIWHGAGLQFAVFGAMHGVMLAGYQMLRWAGRKWRWLDAVRLWIPQWLAVVVTFTLVVISFVFFKAASVDAAWHVIRGMAGATWPATPDIPLGFVRKLALALGQDDLRPIVINLKYGYFDLLIIPAVLAVAWLAPNTQQIMIGFLDDKTRPKSELPVKYSVRPYAGWPEHLVEWRPSFVRAAMVLGLLVCALMMANYQSVEFLYFRF